MLLAPHSPRARGARPFQSTKTIPFAFEERAAHRPKTIMKVSSPLSMVEMEGFGLEGMGWGYGSGSGREGCE